MADLNYWSKLMETDEGAANYMQSYGEGPDFETRHAIGLFINDGDKVLDVGCGPGWNLDHFIKHGPEIYGYKGYDYSERFVRVANERHPNLRPFHLGDVRDIKESDKSWDVVIFQDVLEHTNGYEKPVSEALRVAKKRVIITFWHLTEYDDHINDDGDDGWGAWYSRLNWEEFLDTLPVKYVHFILAPEGKTHKWDFYILEET